MRSAAFFSALVLLPLAALLRWGPPVTPVDYLAAMAAKHARLRSLPSPKVLLLGGSNIGFGMDSEMLEQALCRPVVNMGIHAGLGFRFMVNEVKDALGPGDLVLVALEPSNVARPEKQGDVHYQVVDRVPHAIHYIPWYDRPRVVLGIAVLRAQSLWRKVCGRWTTDGGHPLYRADGFDERGDMLAHLALPRPEAFETDGLDDDAPAVGPAFLPMARELMGHAERNGARVVFIWPGQAFTGFDATRTLAIQAAFREAGPPLIGEPHHFVFPDSAFHDTRYHLRTEGRALRTERTIAALCEWDPAMCCAMQ